MSHVTDIILITFIEDGGKFGSQNPNADKLIEYLEENHQRALNKIDSAAGGDKSMQCDVFAGAINHLYIEKFLDHFKKIEWENPECVQLLIKDEHEDIFTIYTPGE